MPNGYTVGAYYFPNYHVDPRNEALYGKGWTEWELVRHATPRFAGHRQPRVPLWGYQDEADPQVFAQKIEAAADHGLDYFIFDWYWYDDGPFLNRCLDQGYLKAANNERVKFCLMWANCDYPDIMPVKLHMAVHPYYPYPGKVTDRTVEQMTDHLLERYFTHPSYFKIDGCPYFSIYELFTFIEGLGSVTAAQAALRRFRQKARAAGFPDLHLNAVIWGIRAPQTNPEITDVKGLLAALELDSITSYVWIHHTDMPTFPVTPYATVLQEMRSFWLQAEMQYGLAYYPNVTMGWDSSPRTVQSDIFTRASYPFIPTLGDNTPEAFQQALTDVKAFLDNTRSKHKILNINAWNEWTEGSYLEPDTVYGLAYLEAIQTVFHP